MNFFWATNNQRLNRKRQEECNM